MTAELPEQDNRPFAKESVESLTGFDEIAIGNYFRGDFAEVMNSSKSTRALIFIMKKREGMTDPDAFQFAMNLPYGVAGKFFRSTEDEVMEPGEALPPVSTENGQSSSS